ncbi:MAG: hypothetical protein U7123_14905 [Potamolinea sp.]
MPESFEQLLGLGLFIFIFILPVNISNILRLSNVPGKLLIYFCLFYFTVIFLFNASTSVVTLWKITPPDSVMSFGLSVPFIFYVVAINVSLLRSFIRKIKNQRNQKLLFNLAVAVNLLSFCLLLFIVYHRWYQMEPVNNFYSYEKQRQEIVSMIESGKLGSERSRLAAKDFFKERINLPPEYKGLSWKGTVEVERKPGELKVRFIHSTIGFGDGTKEIIYYRSDKNVLDAPYSRTKKLKKHWFYVIVIF